MEENRDIISSLSDDIIFHILSFLSTIDAFRTTLVSTRWKNLQYIFASMAVIDLDCVSFGCKLDNQTSLIDFVNRMLARYTNSHMQKFRLVSSLELETIAPWVSFAISRNIRELDINVLTSYHENKHHNILCEIFSCKTLLVLKLADIFCHNFPSNACLPSLKTLHLRRVDFGDSASSILSICPVLEDLKLDYCILQDWDVLDISHPTLRKFSIRGGYGYRLILNAPSLLYFVYWGSKANGIFGETILPSLIMARIYHYGPHGGDHIITKLVSVVSHARHLYLGTETIEAYSCSLQTLPTFSELTRLEIGFVSRPVLKLLPVLLNSSSRLEVLIFTEYFIEGCDDDYDLIFCENVPPCVSGHLREIEFRAFKMEENECKLVEYFLKEARMLTKIIIRPYLSWEEQCEFINKLSTFSRLSQNCQIVIDSDIGCESVSNVDFIFD